MNTFCLSLSTITQILTILSSNTNITLNSSTITNLIDDLWIVYVPNSLTLDIINNALTLINNNYDVNDVALVTTHRLFHLECQIENAMDH